MAHFRIVCVLSGLLLIAAPAGRSADRHPHRPRARSPGRRAPRCGGHGQRREPDWRHSDQRDRGSRQLPVRAAARKYRKATGSSFEPSKGQMDK